MNMADTAHYIRIQKAFLDENKNAVEMAKISDSSFYNDLDVVVREVINGNVIKNIPLSKVDLNLEGYPKDTGSFFNSPNYAYKFKTVLQGGNAKYRLVITSPSLGFKDSSEISILDTTGFNIPNVSNTTVRYNLNFAKTVPTNSQKLSLFCRIPEVGSRFLEAKVKFYWVDKDLATNSETPHSAEFMFADKTLANQRSVNIESNNISFYSFLREAMGNVPISIERYVDSCDISVAIAAQELYDYKLVSDAQSSGLTADQLKPLYTNILGKDVYGVFSSRVFLTYKNIPLTDETLDSFRVHPITEGLRIRGRTSN